MSDAADAIMQAGIRDAEAALESFKALDAQWRRFAFACQNQQPDLAHAHGERLVTLVESAVDLYLSSHRHMTQFMRLTRGLDE